MDYPVPKNEEQTRCRFAGAFVLVSKSTNFVKYSITLLFKSICDLYGGHIVDIIIPLLLSAVEVEL
jgi:hypothetical protein